MCRPFGSLWLIHPESAPAWDLVSKKRLHTHPCFYHRSIYAYGNRGQCARDSFCRLRKRTRGIQCTNEVIYHKALHSKTTPWLVASIYLPSDSDISYTYFYRPLLQHAVQLSHKSRFAILNKYSSFNCKILLHSNLVRSWMGQFLQSNLCSFRI